jgi:type IV pilus assembly protein PilQ
MNGFIRLLVVLAMVGLFSSCSSAPTDAEGGDGSQVTEGNGEEGFAPDGEAPAEGSGEIAADGAGDGEFAAEGEAPPEDALANEAPPADDFATSESTDDLAAPPPEAEAAQDQAFNPPPDDMGPANDMQAPPPDLAPPPEMAPPPEPMADLAAPPPPPMADLGAPPAPPADLPPAPPAEMAPLAPPQNDFSSAGSSADSGDSARITDIRYRANASGGTVVIETNKPVQYTNRVNENTNQFIIEVQNASLPRKLQRPFNTKDISGAIGAIDAYQSKGASVARVVIQIREGFQMPTVEQEAQSILVMAQNTKQEEAEIVEEAPPTPVEFTESKILPGRSLDDFIAGNTQFFGKKISIEMNEMNLRDALHLITEETGINMVLDDKVDGKITLKLKQVPWDQALVVIMKAKKLGYTRSGNVLRIAPIGDLKTEESDATQIASARIKAEPLVVRMIPISYAAVEEIVKQIDPFLSNDGVKGKAVADKRTSAIVVTDTEERLARIMKIVESLDIPPQQVLIEGKIVEARERFTRSMGVNWNVSGQPVNLSGTMALQSSMSGAPSSLGLGAFNLNLSLGTIDIFGDLSASLALNEREENVKIISSPRVVTLHNEPAEINQTTEVPLVSTTTSSGVISTAVTFKPLKLKLNVTPQITTDGGVIMAVDVSREFAGAVVDERSQAFPVNARSAKTKVLVKNGQTAVIGGIYQSDAAEGEAGVPWLRHIPIFGNFFKASNRSKDKTELLIFLTPRVLGQLDSQVVPRTGGGNL